MSQQNSKVYWPFVFLAFMALFSLGFSDNLRGPFFHQILLDFNFSDSMGSLLFLLPALSGFLVSFFYPVLVSPFLSSQAVLRWSLFLMSFSFLTLSQSFFREVFFLALLVYGLGFGLMSVAQNVIILENSPDHLKRRFLSGLHSQYAFSSLVATFFVFLTQSFLHWSWRESLFFAGLLIFSFGFLSLFLSQRKLKRAESFKKNKDVKKRKFKLFKTGGESAKKPSSLKDLLKKENFHYGLILSFYLFGEVTVSSRLVLFMIRENSLALKEANHFLIAFFVFLLAGRLSFFIFEFRFVKSFFVLCFSLISSVFCLILGLTFSSWFLSLSGLFMAPFFGVFMDYISELFGKRSPELISSAIAISLVSLILLHFLIGFITDFGGIDKALWLAPLGLFLSFLFLVKTRKEKV